MSDSKQTAEVKVRNKRRPFNAPVNKLEVNNPLTGWHYRWVNDEPGRVSKALAGDYVFAEPQEIDSGSSSTKDARASILAGTNKDGSPMLAYLMRIPMEFYLEDKQESQSHLDQIDAAIRGGKTTHINNSYIPEGGISIKTK
jgi:hypothetical protein